MTRPWIPIVLLLGISGCGRSGPVQETPTQLHAVLENEINNALSRIQQLGIAASKEEEADEPADIIDGVRETAKALAEATAGKASEAEARALVTEADALYAKASARASPSTLSDGLKQIQSKAQALRGKL